MRNPGGGRQAPRALSLADPHSAVIPTLSTSLVPNGRAGAAVAAYPEVDVLVNNAGIQRRVDLAAEQDAAGIRAEIAINLEAPIHLSLLVIPHFRRRPSAAIVNVTSGLSFSPLARVPVYSATKAALHSFTLSLRKQLEGTGVEVIEIIPPAVDTDLGGPVFTRSA